MWPNYKAMAERMSSATSTDFSHRWDLSPAGARTLQQRLAQKVVRRTIHPPGQNLHSVAGVDCSCQNDMVQAAVVVLRYADLQPLAEAVARQAAAFAYRPGLLAFREGPAICKAIARLPLRPDLLIVDGHGIAHPRRFGIASHIGLLTGIASIGCGKTRLIGRFEPPAAERGSYSPLIDAAEVVGAAVRTRSHVAPVFVSIGHGVDLADSIRHVLHCCRRYRLPETTRRADRLAASAWRQ